MWCAVNRSLRGELWSDILILNSGGRQCKNKISQSLRVAKGTWRTTSVDLHEPDVHLSAQTSFLVRMLVCVRVCVCVSFMWLHNKSRGKWFIQNFCIILNWHKIYCALSRISFIKMIWAAQVSSDYESVNHQTFSFDCLTSICLPSGLKYILCTNPLSLAAYGTHMHTHQRTSPWWHLL